MDSQNQGESNPIAMPKNRTKIIAASAFGTLILVSIMVFVFIGTQVVYAVSVDGRLVGNLKDKGAFEEIQGELEAYERQHLGAEVRFNQAVEVTEVKAYGNKVSTKEEIKEELKNLLSVKIKAVAIEIDGKEAGIVKDEAQAQAALQGVKDFYINETPGELVKLEVSDTVTLSECYVDPSAITAAEDITKLILQGTPEIKTYEVVDGDCLWTIAQKEGISVEELTAANPQLKDENRLALGEKLNLTQIKPMLNVAVVKNVTYEEDISYSTKTESDSSMWKWDKVVKKPGELGKKEVTAEVSYENGIKVASAVLGEKVIKEPVDRIVVQGTKAEVAFRGTGRFAWPITGQISSSFGKRGGEYHTGLDISSSRGTPIHVSNSGTVSFAGRSGGYGNLVIVDHGGGITTYYAHTDSYSVKAGDAVEKGDVIAKVGSTGRSTGPHLHFEIRIGGTPQNPINYLGK